MKGRKRRIMHFRHALGRGKISTSVHIPGIGISLRKNWGKGREAGMIAKLSQAKCGLINCYPSSSSVRGYHLRGAMWFP
jgi:hypothetical protein